MLYSIIGLSLVFFSHVLVSHKLSLIVNELCLDKFPDCENIQSPFLMSPFPFLFPLLFVFLFVFFRFLVFISFNFSCAFNYLLQLICKNFHLFINRGLKLIRISPEISDNIPFKKKLLVKFILYKL